MPVESYDRRSALNGATLSVLGEPAGDPSGTSKRAEDKRVGERREREETRKPSHPWGERGSSIFATIIINVGRIVAAGRLFPRISHVAEIKGSRSDLCPERGGGKK